MLGYLLLPNRLVYAVMAADVEPLLLPLQTVAVKQPLDAASDDLSTDLTWLQKLGGKPGAPRLLGTVVDQRGKSCIITAPVGRQLGWEMWDSSSNSSSSSAPLHLLLNRLVASLHAMHKEVVIRDLRPGNIVLAEEQLIIVDWGSAVSVQGGAQPYCGTTHYASDRVLKLLQQSNSVSVIPADDLVSLVRSMFAIKHPSFAAQLWEVQDEQDILECWGRVMATHQAWQAAQAEAEQGSYEGLAIELTRLMQ
jgi:serine/threonine protein kinase